MCATPFIRASRPESSVGCCRPFCRPLSEYYADHPIYTLKASNLKRAAARLVLKDDAKAVPVLIDALSSSDLQVRYSAADVLGRIGPAAAPAITALWRMVGSDPHPGDRPGEALARIGPEGIAALIELFHSDNPAQRSGAAQSLRLAGPHSAAAAEALAEALDDAEPAVRQHAAASLGELGIATQTVIAALEKANLDPGLSVRYAARRSLARLSTPNLSPY